MLTNSKDFMLKCYQIAVFWHDIVQIFPGRACPQTSLASACFAYMLAGVLCTPQHIYIYFKLAPPFRNSGSAPAIAHSTLEPPELFELAGSSPVKELCPLGTTEDSHIPSATPLLVESVYMVSANGSRRSPTE